MSPSTSESDLPGLIKQLEILKHAVPTDEATRNSLFDAARSLAFSLETPRDTIGRIAYAAQQTTIARVASDIGLFEILTKIDGRASSTTELADSTSTDKVFLARALRILASNGMINEAGEDLWSASNITKTLSVPGLKAGINHTSDVLMPCLQALPALLVETNYQNPMDVAHGAFQKGHRTDLLPFVWIQTKPKMNADLHTWLDSSREGQNIFLDVFPFETEMCSNLKPEMPLFVDVGGGIGHQCAALKTRLPDIPGRVICQDLPDTLAHAIPMEGVELMGHDFLTPQPIKGASAYYLKNILHDWPDDKCILILQQVIKAMSKDSVILIDEMIIPNQGANWRSTQLDFSMMAFLAGMERTERQWYSLMDKAGLRIQRAWTYTPEMRHSIIMAVPK